MLVAPNHWSPTKIPSLFYVYVPFFFHLLIVLCRLFFPCYKKTTVLDRIIPFSVFYQLPSGLEQRSSTYFSSISPQLMSPRRHYVAQSKGPRPITAVSDLEYTLRHLVAQNKKGHNPKQLRRTSTESFLIRHATDCKKSPCHSSSETNNLSKYETTQNYQTPKQNKTSATITNH